MRAYRTAAGLFAGTLAEAGASASRIEIPDQKEGLINFLNALVSTTRMLADDRPETTICPNAPPPPQPAPTPATAEAITLTDAETFIQQADHRQLCSLFENVVFRGRELVRGAGL